MPSSRRAATSRVRPINKLVDAISNRDGRGWAPYVAPWHGDVEATVLSILRDPGPATQSGTGSGFLCIENDDLTAEFQAGTFAQAGITVGRDSVERLSVVHQPGAKRTGAHGRRSSPRYPPRPVSRPAGGAPPGDARAAGMAQTDEAPSRARDSTIRCGRGDLPPQPSGTLVTGSRGP